MAPMRVLPALVLAAILAAPPAAGAEDPPKPAPPAPAPAPPPPSEGLRRSKAFVDAVGRAIDGGSKWVRTLQRSDGSWTVRPVQQFYVAGDESLGPTALALYTLRACGAPADDPAVKRGFQRLREMYDARKRGRTGLDTYGVSLTLLALESRYAAEAAPGAGDRYGNPPPPAVRIPEADLDWIRDLVRWLCAAQLKGGGFSYWSPAQGGAWDHSNVQFALLALKAARRCGVEVPRDCWARAADHLLDEQERKGPAVGRFEPAPATDAGYGAPPLREVAKDQARGWGYTAGTPATGSMTAGCLSSLAICRSELLGTTLWPAALDRKAVQAVRDGVAWLGLHFTVRGNPGPGGAPAVHEVWHYYYLYGLERAGVLTGLPLFERHDWYLEGAQHLLDEVRDNGSWLGQEALDANTWKGAGPDAATANFLDTCFALLFLKRATFRLDRGAVATEEEALDLDGAAALDDAAFAAVFDAVLGRVRRASGADRDARAADVVRLGVRALPLLVRRLESDDAADRAAAIHVFERTVGATRGYAADGAPGARAAAVAAWEEWWIGAKDRLAADVPAGRFVPR
jgi:hypothetical protein